MFGVAMSDGADALLEYEWMTWVCYSDIFHIII